MSPPKRSQGPPPERSQGPPPKRLQGPPPERREGKGEKRKLPDKEQKVSKSRISESDPDEEECVVCAKIFPSSSQQNLKSTQQRMIKYLLDEIITPTATPTIHKPKLTLTSLSLLHLCPNCVKNADLVMDYKAQLKQLQEDIEDSSQNFKNLAVQAQTINSGPPHQRRSELDVLVHQIRNFIGQSEEQVKETSNFPSSSSSDKVDVQETKFYVNSSSEDDQDINTEEDITPVTTPEPDPINIHKETPTVEKVRAPVGSKRASSGGSSGGSSGSGSGSETEEDKPKSDKKPMEEESPASVLCEICGTAFKSKLLRYYHLRDDHEISSAASSSNYIGIGNTLNPGEASSISSNPTSTAQLQSVPSIPPLSKATRAVMKAALNCRNFLCGELGTSQRRNPQVANNVKSLIQGLVDGEVNENDFYRRVTKELYEPNERLNLQYQLTWGLLHFRYYLATSNQLTLEGIRPPLLSSLPDVEIINEHGKTIPPPLPRHTFQR